MTVVKMSKGIQNVAKPVGRILRFLFGWVGHFSATWKVWRKQIARRDHPTERAKWEAIMNKW